MADDARAELMAASGQLAVTHRDLLKDGRTVWYRGKAAPAEAGTVAIDTETGGRIIIGEKDIRKVERDGPAFLVEVTVDAEVLIRFEAIVKADPTGCECNNERPPRAPSMDLDEHGAVLCIGGIVWYCRWYVGVSGWPLRICTPMWDRCKDWYFWSDLNPFPSSSSE